MSKLNFEIPSVNISWGSTGASKYELYRDDALIKSYDDLGGNIVADYTDKTVTWGKTYTYVIKSYRSDGSSLKETDPFTVVIPAENIDTDGDGLPDLWEIKYSENNAQDDPDNDGFTNLQEYQNGTDPHVKDFAALTAEAGTYPAITEDDTITLDGSTSTGNIVTYKWTRGNAVACENSVQCEQTLHTAGEFTYTLTVTDADGNVATDDVIVTVNPNTSAIPSAPTNVQATYLGNKQIKITWTDTSDNETGFEIFNSLNTVYATPNADKQEVTFADEGIEDGVEYHYTLYVVAKNGDIRSKFDSVTFDFTGQITQNTSKVLKTGQTSCYDYDTNAAVPCTDAHKGQDGYYATIKNIGLDRSYSSMADNDGNHIAVRDNATGIIWQDNESVYKPWVTQENYNAGNYSDTSGDTAATYCQNLPLSGTWRVPTIKELQTLPDFAKVNPAIDIKFQNKTSRYYWSSTTNAYNSGYAWYVNFNYGYSRNSYKSPYGYVRCVRSGQ